jgi:predicted nucleotidyltransferase
MNTSNTPLERATSYSDNIINILRERFEHELDSKCYSIVTVGSFARREASDQSDLDFFIIDDSEISDDEYTKIKKIIGKADVKMPSSTGAFNEIEKKSDMVRNVGGFDDTTEKLTRRMLFLFECEWLYNKELFFEVFNLLINKYVQDLITQHQLCRFLLNDLIRYYRTICVDFEFKTSENKKSWGDRNIKLLFSRKLLYFSGIIVIAETVQHYYKHKREILSTLLRKTPIERVRHICGVKSEKAISLYTDFLVALSSHDVREMLNITTADRNLHSPEFRKLKNNGHHFSWELSRLLTETYDSAHPIHLAIKF